MNETKSKTKLLTKDQRCSLWKYLFFTFAIAWEMEFLLLAVYRLELLSGIPAQIFHYTVIGFGAGMAPAYAAFIVQKTTLKDFCRQIFVNFKCRKTAITLIVFAAIQFAACAAQETYLGYAWYMFIPFMLLMILGGGLEEIGWSGVFQPLLEKRFSFIAAALIEGVIWSVWHLPLWLVPNASQGAMNFAAFALYCITLRITLAAAYRLTQCVWAAVLIHAWGNTVLGSMFTLTSLTEFPRVRTLVVYLVQILAVIVYYLIARKFTAKDNNLKIEE